MVDVKEFAKLIEHNIVLDVRPAEEYQMCNLPRTINFSFTRIQKDGWDEELRKLLKRFRSEKSQKGEYMPHNLVYMAFIVNIFLISAYVLCRRGNDSQRAIIHFKSKLMDTGIQFYNVKGGLHAYAKKVDPSFPVY